MARPFSDADVFSATAYPVRRRILELLRTRDRSPTQLAIAVGRAPATVSAHLRVLRKLGLVSLKEHGPRITYRIEAAGLRRIAVQCPADLIVIDLDHATLAGWTDDTLLDAFVFGGGAEAIQSVCVNGVWRETQQRQRK